ncbi:MAG TPA: class I SAM-dependent methyltransferase [Thermodesulfobacteriota bacterium]
MGATPDPTLSARQRREIDYHRERAAEYARTSLDPVSLHIARATRRRWWNAYWHAWTWLRAADPAGRRALVVGCGFGDDAVRLAALGARVSAFDLSPESLEIARLRAAAAGYGDIEFRRMPCEALEYRDGSFEIVLAVDILHHVDIPTALRELARVAAPGALLVCNEPYTHRSLERLRRTRPVERWAYPLVARWMHGAAERSALYITEDERKLCEADVDELRRAVPGLRVAYFNAVAGRIVPDRLRVVARAERAGLRLIGPAARVLAGRFVASGRFPARA